MILFRSCFHQRGSWDKKKKKKERKRRARRESIWKCFNAWRLVTWWRTSNVHFEALWMEHRVQGLQLTERVNIVLDVHLSWSNVGPALGSFLQKHGGCVYLTDGWKGWKGAVEKRQHFSGNEPCQASISREGKIETSNKSMDNPFKMEVDGPRTLRERMCVRISECIPLDWWMVSVISDEVFIGDFIFDSWIRFHCLNKFYIQFKLMDSLIFDGIFYLVIIWLFFYSLWDDSQFIWDLLSLGFFRCWIDRNNEF